MHTKIKRGEAGEQQAAAFLQAQGYSLRACNWRYKRGEIDLIAERGNWLVFVEVKTRSSLVFGFPEEFVTEKKKKMVLTTAAHYLEQSQWPGQVRYDVIAVTLGTVVSIEHFEDAFY